MSTSNLPFKVLVVDDMPSLREALGHCLRKMKLNVIYEATDGDHGYKKAIEHAEEDGQKPFDIIFTDLNMPNCNGLELLKKLRQSSHYAETPIIMVTTENEASIVLDAIESGADEYVIKPFDDDVVKKKVMTVFKKKQMI